MGFKQYLKEEKMTDKEVGEFMNIAGLKKTNNSEKNRKILKKYLEDKIKKLK